MSQYVGRRIVPAHGGVWDNSKNYEELIIVLYENSGDSYISRRPVPAGTSIQDTNYWMLYSLWSEQVTVAEKHLNDTAAAIRSEMNANTKNINKSLQDTTQTINASLQATEKTVDDRAAAAEKMTTDNKAELSQRMTMIEARQEANVKASTEPDADYAAEVVDARVDIHGTDFQSLGARLRFLQQSFICTEMDGLFIFASDGNVAKGHESYVGACTTKISYSRNFGDIQIEKENLVINHNVIAAIAFYDCEKKFCGSISKESYLYFDDFYAGIYADLIPEETAYFAVSLKEGTTMVRFRLSGADWYKTMEVMLRQLEEQQLNHTLELAKLEAQARADLSCSKNLLDVNSPYVIAGYYLGSSGKMYEHESYSVSNYIPVIPGNEYTYAHGTGGAYCDIYDIDFKVIGSFKGPADIVIPENGAYVRVSFWTNSANAMFLETRFGKNFYEQYVSLYDLFQQVEKNYMELSDSISNKLSIQLGKNLFDKDSPNIIMGKYLNSDGMLASNELYCITDYIKVEPGESYHPYGFGAGGAYHCVYADDKRTVVLAFKDTTVVIPENGRFVRLSARNDKLNDQQFEKGSEFTGYEPYVEYSALADLSDSVDSLGKAVAELKQDTLKVVLPRKLYFCVGSSLPLYYENILFKSLTDPGDLYCNRAKNYSRLMSFVFDTEESGMLDFNICKALKRTYTQKFEYQAISPAKLMGKNIRLIFIGDSFTDIGSYAIETQKLLEANDASVELIGTCGSTKFKAEGLSGGTLVNTFLNASSGVARIVQVQNVNIAPNTGYPGRTYRDTNGNEWTIRGSKIDSNGNGKMVVTKFGATEASFENFPTSGTLTKVAGGGEGDDVIQYTGSKKAYYNPFINPANGELDIRYYLTEWGFADPDVVILQFTWNDLSTWVSDCSRLVANFKNAVDHIHMKLPNAKVVISIEPFGAIYSGKDWNGKKYSVLNLVNDLSKQFETEEYASFCRIAPSYACVDLIEGYSTAKVIPCSRYKAEETSGGDGVHPNVGMLQIADCIYPVITSLIV